MNYGDVTSAFGSQPLPDPSHLGDPNSPEVFKQYIHLVIQHLARVQGLARSAMAGIEQAYRPGTNPIQTTADIVTLKQATQALLDVLRQTGVGALPMPSSEPMADFPTEESLMANTTRALQVLYDRQKQMQESSAVASNLLGAVDQAVKK